MGSQSPLGSGQRQVEQALQEFGCFEALFDKIPLETRKTIFGGVEELFDLPLEIKTRHVSKIPFHGYVGQHPKIPLYESISFDNAHLLGNVEAQSRTFWPQGQTSFSKIIQSFAKELRELSHMIRRMILEIFQVEKYMDEHMEWSEYLLKSNSSGEWIDCNPSKDAFVVTIGESLHSWLNGRLKATYHRLMLSGDKPKYSVGLFTVPKAGYMMKAPKELVNEAPLTL
ncbi:putative 2-oxoglutarate (2OG) and Fe(II)-dependent oxygenase superfamily protein [Hibiscus syriacus]|uniref:2-oxoglutarate (2OG) and Fe(II)-dependent oxygenase superfamily protein n=1 Tax=Hibiscus syriacus TaxID=106335 RepID=A0A6A3AQD1_HIBSY|nr:putative 2-oxoglutarate (2OG) and Fe(II)-dependent oxygenase superfamily protein [Hibiscus syriacus]